MKKKIVISILSLVLTTGLILTGCSSLSVSTSSDAATESTETSETDASEETTDSTDTAETTETSADTTETTTDTGELITPIESLDLTDMFSSGDLETGYDESTSTVVTLDGDSISI